MSRRRYSVVLAVLLCVAGLVVIVAIDVLGQVTGWVDVAVASVAGAIVLLAIYMIARPPSITEDGEDEPGGGTNGPSPTRPDSPVPHDGLPEPDWGSFDDLRQDWERTEVLRGSS